MEFNIMVTITLNESQLRELIKESVEQAMLDEGFFDNMKAAWRGAKQGYKAQDTIDRGVEGFKRHHDYEDLQKQANPFGPGMENTAEEQAREIYSQYKEYATMANRLLAKYNKMVKTYGLKKVAPGNVVEPSANPNFKGSGVPISRKSAYAVGGKQNPSVSLR